MAYMPSALGAYVPLSKNGNIGIVMESRWAVCVVGHVCIEMGEGVCFDTGIQCTHHYVYTQYIQINRSR